MQQSLNRLTAEEKGEAGLSSRREAQQLHYHLGELRKSVGRAHALRVDFQALTQDAHLNITAAEALRQDINLLAGRLGVSALPAAVRRLGYTKGKKQTGDELP
jgi:hypothetical protein